MVSVAIVYGGNDISLTGQEASSQTLPAKVLAWCSGVQDIRSLIDWIVLDCREAGLNAEDLPGHVGLWKSTEEVQQILRKL